MSKKHYVKIAAALRELWERHTDPAERTILAEVANSYSVIAIDDNPNFNKHRFLVACGMDSN